MNKKDKKGKIFENLYPLLFTIYIILDNVRYYFSEQFIKHIQHLYLKKT